MGADISDKVIPIDGFKSQQLILLQFVILDPCACCVRRGGLEAWET